MSDHDFEKQVQQKLGELKLRPSDAVWMEVEKNIRDKKRRRRFLWLWSAALSVTLTTSGIILYHYNTRRTITIGETTTQTTQGTLPSSANSISNSNTNSTTNTVSPNSTNTQASIDNRQSTNGNEPGEIPPAEATASTGNRPRLKAGAIGNESGNATMPNKVAILPTTPSTGELVPTGGEGRGEALKHNNKKFVTNRKKTTSPKTEEAGEVHPVDQLVFTDVEPVSQPDALTAAIPTLAAHDQDSIITNKATTEPFNNISLNALLPDSATSANAIAAMPIQRKKASVWHWGVKADAGYSRISVSKLFQLKGLLGTQKSYAEDLANRSYSADPATSTNQFLNVAAGVTPVKKVASPIQPDFSASFGIFIQRTITPRLKISVGLEYSYMSVNTGVGKAFNDPITVNIGANT
ncbi:MAG TPA: hypothetical protein VGE79_06435, partial [Niastella sp.]